VTLKITLFAALKDLAGIDSFSVTAEGGSTGRHVLELVGKEFPVLLEHLPYVRLASEERYLATDAVIDPASTPELYIIPPVSGG
jgi:molybdopterin converting factor small subunit